MKSILTLILFLVFADFTKAQHQNKIGFQKSIISPNMVYFKIFDSLGFYLQDAYVKDWVSHSMIFPEVDNIEQYYHALKNLALQDKYNAVRLIPIKNNDWGSECFLHAPSGIRWHFGAFKD